MPIDMNQTFSRVDQVNIWAVLSYLAGQWRWYVIGGVAGLVVGVLYFWILPPKYEASVVIQPARVGSILRGSSARVQSDELEPAPLMIERLKQASFFTPSIRERCQVPNELDYQKNMAGDITANLVKLPNPTFQSLSMAKISWRGQSPEVAQDCLEAIVEAVTQAQNQIIAPALATLVAQKERTQKQVELYYSELANLRGKGAGSQSPASNFNQIVIADKAAQNLRESLANLVGQLSEETAQLMPPYSQPVSKLEPIYASHVPTITLKIALALGVLIGVLCGIFALLVTRSILLYRASTPN